tara:strand:+ start:4635 stop:4814 length:180 start_codon:yes stop_codon:yes gene_type:complete
MDQLIKLINELNDMKKAVETANEDSDDEYTNGYRVGAEEARKNQLSEIIKHVASNIAKM